MFVIIATSHLVRVCSSTLVAFFFVSFVVSTLGSSVFSTAEVSFFSSTKSAELWTGSCFTELEPIGPEDPHAGVLLLGILTTRSLSKYETNVEAEQV